MKLLSLFSGIGAFEKALENLGEPVDLINYCEIDKYASKAFALIHNVDESKNLRDVCSINTNELPKDIDLITYGFPCQDISNAGKQRGFVNEDGQLTRSGLFFTALHIIEETKPKIAIAENVKALTSKKFTSEFQTVLTSLNQAGYQNYWSVLNAKDYGIPQNRERVFIISIRNDIAHGFDFPQKQELKLRLRDMLEENVDEKYYLSEKMISGFLKHNINHEIKGTGFKWQPTDTNGALNATDNSIITVGNYMKSNHNASRIVDTCGLAPTVMENHGTVTAIVENSPKANDALCPTDNDDAKIKRLFNVLGYEKSTNFAGNVYDKNGLAPTLQTAQGGYRQPMIIEEQDGCVLAGSLNKEGWHDFSNRVYSPDGIARTLMATGGGANEKTGLYLMPDSECLLIKEATSKGFKEAHDGDYINLLYPNSKTRRGRVGDQIANTLQCTEENGVVENLRIRKLTPKECFRLMGFDDRDCDILIENKISNTQLYKMAGNSIVVDVLENIFRQLSSQYSDLFQNNIKTEKSQQICTWDVRSDWQSRQVSIFDLLN